MPRTKRSNAKRVNEKPLVANEKGSKTVNANVNAKLSTDTTAHTCNACSRSTMISSRMFPVSIFASGVIGALIAFLALRGTNTASESEMKKHSPIHHYIHDVFFQHNTTYSNVTDETNSTSESTRGRIISTNHENINNEHIDTNVCKYYLAKSSIPNSGLGIYTSEAIKAGDRVGQDMNGGGEVVIPIPDINPNFVGALHTLLFDYVWDGEEVGAQYEGQKVYSVIPGIGMLANGHHIYDNIKQSFGPSIDHGGLVRSKYPGAGAISHYHNYTFVASKDIEAGGELMVNYGINWFKEREKQGKIILSDTSQAESKRNIHWLRENGVCLDNIKVGMSTNPQAGRGAFATRSLPKGSVVAPAPIVQILDRKSLQLTKIKTDAYGREQLETVDQLLLNYCFGSTHSSLLFFPYAPFVNYINHKSTANVKLRWSESPHHDHQNVNDMTIEDVTLLEHGGLMLEFVALRDIEENEEIFLDYGQEWEDAWNNHVNRWKMGMGMNIPSTAYASNLDKKSKVIRTEMELQQNPYPPNIFTSCYYSYRDGKKQNNRQGRMYVWQKTDDILHDRNLRPCSVLNRHNDVGDGNEYYTVAVRNRFGLKDSERIPQGEMHLVTNVPRSAIRFSNKIFTTDLHLSSGFRHAIHIDNIFPSHWKE